MKKNTYILILGALLVPFTSLAIYIEGAEPTPVLDDGVTIMAEPAVMTTAMPEVTTKKAGMHKMEGMEGMHDGSSKKDHECMMKNKMNHEGGDSKYAKGEYHKGHGDYHASKYSFRSHYGEKYHKSGWFWVFKTICLTLLLGYLFLAALVIRKGWEMGANTLTKKKK